MIIELERIPAPEDMGERTCAICAEDFEQGVVLAFASTEGGTVMGEVCPGCVEYMGSHLSERFPTGEEYRRLEGEWLTPLYTSGEEAERADMHRLNELLE